MNSGEMQILHDWEIRSLPPFVRKEIHLVINLNSPSVWSPPPDGTFKLKFDGASKGNPDLTGFGGVVRNNVGSIQGVFGAH